MCGSSVSPWNHEIREEQKRHLRGGPGIMIPQEYGELVAWHHFLDEFHAVSGRIALHLYTNAIRLLLSRRAHPPFPSLLLRV
jgi:hypothetical protein